jgi:hypothetical protein
MNKKLNIILLLIALACSSCEKVIEIDFPQGEAPYCVEGYIENGELPYVTITRGTSFFGTISVEDYANLFVGNADVRVTVSDGAEYVLSPITIGNITLYTNLNFSGEVGKRYDLRISVDGKVFESSTTILEPQPFDSVTFKLRDGDAGTLDSLVEITAYFRDPSTPENYYRFLTRRNSEPLFDSRNSYLFPDLLLNGLQWQVPVFRGSLLEPPVNPDSVESERSRYFMLGDTVYMKWASIDQAQFRFWDTFSSQSGSFGNPFAPTVIIKSNVTGPNCIGLWASYGSFLDTLIVE